MNTAKILLRRDGPVATITLNRPEKLNALDVEMLEGIDTACAELEVDRAVRVVKIDAAGERAFCVGADIEAWAALSPKEMAATWVPRGHRIFGRLAQLPQPVIAVLHGHVLGGGLELALAADLRIAALDARLGLPEVKLGTVPGWAGTARLPAIVGAARAEQMIFTGASIDAQTALVWGLVNEVAAREQLAAAADALAQTIAANAPLAVTAAKRLLAAATLDACEAEGAAGAALASTRDLHEGLMARRERRAPRFKGE